MNTDWSSSVESRAARHTALADPTRVRIVDALSLGDLSPVELQDRLGIGSNLLSHHLRILTTVGMVGRHRSEGDRRRVYLRLQREALAELCSVGEPGVSARRVVFVCTANSARSQLAAALWARSTAVPVTSAGTRPAARVHAGAMAAARRHGLSLVDATPQPLEAALGEDDLVVTVCDNAREELAARSVLHWSVPDPVRVGTTAAFEAAYDELCGRVTVLSDRLASNPDH